MDKLSKFCRAFLTDCVDNIFLILSQKKQVTLDGGLGEETEKGSLSHSTNSVTMYEDDTTMSKMTDRILFEPLGEQVVAQTQVIHNSPDSEPIIHFIINEEKSSENENNEEVSIVDSNTGAIITTGVVETASCTASSSGEKPAEEKEEVLEEMVEEQAFVNAEEGTSVVVGAFSEGEGGSMEEGSVTIPFRDLAQLLGGKHYKCDACSQSFGISPNATYNMVHTGQSHILVISLNDHWKTS